MKNLFNWSVVWSSFVIKLRHEENLIQIPSTFVGIINDCIAANKIVVIIKGHDEWPWEYQRQYGTINLYWIVRDGGLMLFLSQLLLTNENFET
ncbi:Cation-chloride cotransporter 1 [Acorus calamus]|uniref:Cation-chloride cotransporter 1 n=1 Tax=Acorus calamus TaxID=4465 RepID=A0AAV9ESS3_ACOCL|nr:Cation-chloride cotransporter 1 [Acorus calamus]